jgi:hypothetical protein
MGAPDTHFHQGTALWIRNAPKNRENYLFLAVLAATSGAQRSELSFVRDDDREAVLLY